MIIKGKYGEAIVFNDNVEETAYQQIEELCNQKFTQDCKIRIMSDVHSGSGCVIGFTANLKELVIPNIVGVDIGCGMLTVDLKMSEFSFEDLDKIIHQYVPSGYNIHDHPIAFLEKIKELYCYKYLKHINRFERSIGTLGGGNHFIEIDEDENQNRYLIIHTGSRNLGKQVAQYYQNLAIELCKNDNKEYKTRIKEIIDECKALHQEKKIEERIKLFNYEYRQKELTIPEYLCYLTGEYRDMYLHDMQICQEFAKINRETIAQTILYHLFHKKLNDYQSFETIHNYIDLNDQLIRKGAISAKKDEIVLIPMNMKDGCLLAKGKGNDDWNQSAPHGAGRLYSRKCAREMFSLEDFKKSMKGIYSSSIKQSTLDESPFAYKPMEEILHYINPTVDVIKILKPVFNFKASD